MLESMKREQRQNALMGYRSFAEYQFTKAEVVVKSALVAEKLLEVN